MTRLQQRLLVLAGLVVIGVLMLAGYTLAQDVNAGKRLGLRYSSLPPPEEMGDYAIEYTRARFQILSGTPEVLVSRQVTSIELRALGLDAPDFVCEEPPLTLVILKGDFDANNMPGIGKLMDTSSARVSYIAYVFDMLSGIPTAILTADTPSDFALALNDPTIPTSTPQHTLIPDPNLVPLPAGEQLQPNPLRTRCAYGSVVPTVTLR